MFNQSDCSQWGQTDTCCRLTLSPTTCSQMTSGRHVNDLCLRVVIRALIRKGAGLSLCILMTSRDAPGGVTSFRL